MRRPSITFLRATQLNSRVRRVTPAAVRTDRWVLTSPGGIASTFGDLPGLREFASVVLGRDRVPLSYQAA